MKPLLYILCLISFSLSAQIKGTVVDEAGKPIPYVNIWVENGTMGTTSEETGYFSLALKDQEQKLIFSALGYEAKTIDVDQAGKVVLKPSAIKLEEVVVKKNPLKQKKEIGYYEASGFRYHMANFVDAVYFNISEEEREQYPFIKDFKFKTLSSNQNALIRIYFVAPNEDGSPGNRILSDEVILEVKKGNTKNTVDLSTKKISIPENGFFIVFERLKIEQNKRYEEYTFKDSNGNKTTSKGLLYEPEIPLVPVELAVGWHKQFNDRWEKTSKTILQNPNSFENILMRKYHNKYLVPAVSVTLSN